MKTKTLFFVFMTGHFSFAQPAIPSPMDDLIISEVFPDPTPSYGLPEVEFIELFNSGPDTIQLKGTSISDSDKSNVLPDFKLSPYSFLLLCKSADVVKLKPYGQVLGIASIISLNNDGDEISVRSSSGKLLSQLVYGSDYEPGKSIENTNLESLCIQVADWSISKDLSGGTPGKVNSMDGNTAIVKPDLLEVQLSSDTTIDLIFNLSLQPLEAQNGTFTIDGGNITCSPYSYAPATKNLTLKPDRALLSGGIYSLKVSGVRSCQIDTLQDFEIDFLKTIDADSGDLLINELLFNPFPGCNDFIEIYNTSSKYIDVKNLQLANTQNGLVANLKKISDKPLIIAPGGYLALTSDKNQLIQKYPHANAEHIAEATLPAWNDDAGSAILMAPNAEIIDQFNYDKTFHLSLLVETEGISLERISFTSPASSIDNWHSAAAGFEFATPGSPNSQMYTPGISTGWSIDPASFSPDGDGYKDFTAINYTLPVTQIASVQVYDVQGRLVKKLSNNLTLASAGFIQWDGLLEDATLAPSGYYIVHIRTFDEEGNTHEEKKPVVVSFKD